MNGQTRAQRDQRARRQPRSCPATAPRLGVLLGDVRWLLRHHLGAFLTAVLLGQGALTLLILPLSNRLFTWVLASADIDGISQESLGKLLTSPVALMALGLNGLIVALALFAQIAVLTSLAHRANEGAPLTVHEVLREVIRSGRALLSWQVLLFGVYGFVLLPLAEMSIVSDLTAHIAIPRFISDELMKTGGGIALYAGALFLIAYLALRLSLTQSALLRGDRTVLAAMRTSLRLTRQGQLRFFWGIVVIGAAVALPTGLLAIATALPVWLSSSGSEDSVALVSGFALATAHLVVFLGGGFLSAASTGYAVARHRRVSALPMRQPTRGDDEAAAGRSRVRHRVLAGGVAALTSLTVLGHGVVLTGALALDEDPADTLVIAHRGYAAAAVENSLDALRDAATAGAELSELDVQETRDGEFVVFHDATLSRLAGDSRRVSELTVAELRSLTLHQRGYRSVIPTLAEYVAEADRLNIRLLIELKPTGDEAPRFAERVTEQLGELDPERRHLLQSLDRPLINQISELDPTRKTAAVVGLQLGLLPETDAEIIAIESWSYSDAMLGQAVAAGKQIFVWTVNEDDQIRALLARRVHGIITDRVPEAIGFRQLVGSPQDPMGRYLDTLLLELTPLT